MIVNFTTCVHSVGFYDLFIVLHGYSDIGWFCIIGLRISIIFCRIGTGG
jgi:hypothetical protein